MKNLQDIRINLDELKRKDVDNKIDFSLLYEFVSLLNLDNGRNEPVLLKAAALSLNVFIEKHIEERFSLEPTALVHKEENLLYNWLGRFSVRKEQDAQNTKINKVVEMKVKQPGDLHAPGWEEPYYKSALSRTIIALHCHYNIPVSDINSVIKLINDRNAVAHKGEDISINTNDMCNIMYNVVFKMIELDLLPHPC